MLLLNPIMLSVTNKTIMLSVIMLSVILLSVFMLIIVFRQYMKVNCIEPSP